MHCYQDEWLFLFHQFLQNITRRKSISLLEKYLYLYYGQSKQTNKKEKNEKWFPQTRAVKWDEMRDPWSLGKLISVDQGNSRIGHFCAPVISVLKDVVFFQSVGSTNAKLTIYNYTLLEWIRQTHKLPSKADIVQRNFTQTCMFWKLLCHKEPQLLLNTFFQIYFEWKWMDLVKMWYIIIVRKKSLGWQSWSQAW